MKRVLVLMATYNGEKYINEQIESLFAQEGVQVSLLVRDDGSTDNTTTILDNWSKKSDTRWYTGPHLNAKYGFFELLCKASETNYEYFAFCDQDDVWDRDKLAIALERLEQVPDNIPGLYYCGQRLVNEQLELLSVHKLNPHRTVLTRFLIGDIAGCTAVFNKTLVQIVSQYRPAYMRMHDLWIMKVCAALGGEVIVDPQAHLAYRQHGNNVEGLQDTLRSKMHRFVRYYKHSITAHMEQLKLGYTDSIIPQYQDLIDLILACRTKPQLRWQLLKNPQINFYNKGVNLVFFLKVLFNRI